MNGKLDSFENKVLLGLKQCGVKLEKRLRLGAAVSGGADSVSLLLALCKIAECYGLPLFVVTVNHNIREENESAGDAAFVKALCEKLSKTVAVHFVMKEIPRGEVFERAEWEKCGIEAAARELRYELFESFIKENNVDFLCLAHNLNDQLETSLMRFFQGSWIEASGGIKNVREKYVRPLLEIGRDEIEAYLNGRRQEWRTDSTNSDDSYLRNNIRLNLIPFLDEKFPGWKTAVLNGGKKNRIDGEIIEKKALDFEIDYDADGGVQIDWKKFLALERGIQFRVMTRCMNLCGLKNRIPFAFLQETCEFLNEGKTGKKYFSGVEISCKNSTINVKNYVKIVTDFVFSDIINMEGTYDFSFGKVEVLKNYGDCAADFCVSVNGSVVLESCHLPVLVRSYLPDDEVLCKDGGCRKVSDIYSGWHVPENDRSFIPVIQDLSDKKQKILCILGECSGFYNWIVK